MPQSHTTFRLVVIAALTLLMMSCAASQKMELPAPVATSIEDMPPDAGLVVKAVLDRMMGEGQGNGGQAEFVGDTGSTLAETWRFIRAFFHTGTRLNQYEAQIDDPSSKAISGQFDFESSLGRRASAMYQARYHGSAETGILI